MKNEVREMSIRKRKNGFGISSDAGEILFKEFETADWLSKDEENDLLREAKGDGKLGFDEQAFLERINGAKKEIPNVGGNSKIDKFNEYGKIDLLKMAQNGSENDLGWKPKNDNEWQSRMYANNTAQATDLSSSGGKQPSTFELSDPDTVGIFIQPGSSLRLDDFGHVGFLIAEKGGNGSAIGYNYGRYTVDGEGNSVTSGETQGRLLKESYPLRRLENGGIYYEIAADKEGARRIHQKQLELENDAYDLVEAKYLKGENTLNRKEFYRGKWAKYDLTDSSSCVFYTIEVIQAGFPKDSPAYMALEAFKIGKWGTTTPNSFDIWLRQNGEEFGIIRRRVKY